MIIQDFRNRERELKELNRSLESNIFELIIIYGRRRIGKTELVLKATESKRPTMPAKPNITRIFFIAPPLPSIRSIASFAAQLLSSMSPQRPDRRPPTCAQRICDLRR